MAALAELPPVRLREYYLDGEGESYSEEDAVVILGAAGVGDQHGTLAAKSAGNSLTQAALPSALGERGGGDGGGGSGGRGRSGLAKFGAPATDVVNETCCGGGKRVLTCVRAVYTLGIRRSWGVSCALTWFLYALLASLLTLPMALVVVYVHVRDGGFLGAFSLFALVPLTYLFCVAYFRQAHIVALFEEVGLHGAHYARLSERVIRRHCLVVAIGVPSGALLMSVAFFATSPLASIARTAASRILGITSVPVFVAFAVMLGVPAVFAATFSVMLSLLRLLIDAFVSRLDSSTPSVEDSIALHRTLVTQIERHIAHWRAAYTATVLMSMLGFGLTFYTLVLNSAFNREMIPFAAWLLAAVAAMQVLLFWSVALLVRECDRVRLALERREASLSALSNERVVLAVHGASNQLSVRVFGFTGLLSVDLPIGLFVALTLFFMDHLAG